MAANSGSESAYDYLAFVLGRDRAHGENEHEVHSEPDDNGHVTDHQRHDHGDPPPNDGPEHGDGGPEHRLDGTAGNDTLTGDAHDNAIDGRGGDDILEGGDGRDVLFGGAGNDWLSGGEGHDFLWGQSGADTFLFTSADGIDIIRDFVSGADLIAFDRASFDIGPTATVADVVQIGGTAPVAGSAIYANHGHIFFDDDWSTPVGREVVATFGTSSEPILADFILV